MHVQRLKRDFACFVQVLHLLLHMLPHVLLLKPVVVHLCNN
jgi:hypothetical protein